VQLQFISIAPVKISGTWSIANALEKPVQASPENALNPAIFRLAFTVLKGVCYILWKSIRKCDILKT